MKMPLILLVLAMLCTSCTALPAEERAFAVALFVEREGNLWRVYGRIPTYQSSGGYLTVAGEGVTLAAAVNAMSAAAPMHMHLSQLRLLVAAEEVAESEDLAEVLRYFSEQSDMRQDCMVAVCDVQGETLMNALTPSAGERLSKAVDVLLDTRIEQGRILPARLSDVVRNGTRQSAVLIAMTLRNGKPELSGGYPLTLEKRAVGAISSGETQMLALLCGNAKSMQITLGDVSAEVRLTSVKKGLDLAAKEAGAELTLHLVNGTDQAASLEQELAAECARLLTKLYASGCDVMGLGRKAVCRFRDMEDWNALNWPGQVRQIRWTVSVRITSPA